MLDVGCWMLADCARLTQILTNLQHLTSNIQHLVFMRRVVITGLGLVTPIGAGRELFWRNLTAGANGIGPVESFDTSAFPVHIGAEVKDFDPSGYVRRGSP